MFTLVLLVQTYVFVNAQEVQTFALVMGEHKDVLKVYQYPSQPAPLNTDLILDQLNMGIFQACHLPPAKQFYQISPDKGIIQSTYNGALKSLNPQINGGQGPIYDSRNLSADAYNFKYELHAVLKQINNNQRIYDLVGVRDLAWQVMHMDIEQALEHFNSVIEKDYAKIEERPIQQAHKQFEAAASISNSVGYLQLTQYHWKRLLNEIKLYIQKHSDHTVRLRLYCLSKDDGSGQHFAPYKYTFRYLLGTFDSGLKDHQQRNIYVSVKLLGKDKFNQPYFNIPQYCEQEYYFDQDSLPQVTIDKP